VETVGAVDIGQAAVADEVGVAVRRALIAVGARFQSPSSTAQGIHDEVCLDDSPPDQGTCCSTMVEDEADVAALGISTWNQLLKGGELGVEAFWTSPHYCHCNFTALPALDPALRDPWVTHLLAMDWDNPAHRTILELEGLTRWVRPELDGYASLFEAVQEQNVSFRW